MIGHHLSDSEFHKFASQPTLCDKSIAEHLESCDTCREQAKVYQVLFSSIGQQERPAFDFDLSALVISQLEPAKPKFSWEIFAVYLFAFVGVAAILFSGILFQEYCSSLFSGSSTIFLYMFIAISLITILFQGFEIFRKYQKQMDTLNIS
jgi:hypothetical protein